MKPGGHRYGTRSERDYHGLAELDAMAPAIRDEAGPSVEPTTPFQLAAVTSISWRSVGRCNESLLALLGPLSGMKTQTNRKEMIA